MPGPSSGYGRWFWKAGLGLLLLGVLGCGGKKLYPVDGRVTFPDGTPLTGGWVTFEPVDRTHQVVARGDIQPDGTFRLSTYRDGDGAPEGKYRVMVNPPPGNPRNEKNPDPPLMHPKFQQFDSTALERTVTSDNDKNHFTLVVERP